MKTFILEKLSLFVLLLICSSGMYAGTVSGTSPVCPGTTGNYSFSRDNTSCTAIDWRVYENGSLKSSGWSYSGTSCTVNWSSSFSSGEVWVREMESETYGDPPQYTNPCDHWGSWSVKYVGRTVSQPFFDPMNAAFCHGSTKTVSISTQCSGERYDWEVPSGWSINGGGNTLTNTTSQSISVTAPSSGSGTHNIKVKKVNDSWVYKLVQLDQVLSSQVNLGKSYNMYDYTMCPSTNYAIIATGPPSTNFTNWSFSGDFSSTYGYGNQAAVTTSYNYTGGYISVQASNYCPGPSVTVGRTFSLSYSCPYSMMAEEDVKVYPNPVTTELTVEWPEDGDVTEVILFDGDQEVVASSKVEKGKSQLKMDVKGLKAGTYFLNLTNGKNVLQKQIIKE